MNIYGLYASSAIFQVFQIVAVQQNDLVKIIQALIKQIFNQEELI